MSDLLLPHKIVCATFVGKPTAPYKSDNCPQRGLHGECSRANVSLSVGEGGKTVDTQPRWCVRTAVRRVLIKL